GMRHNSKLGRGALDEREGGLNFLCQQLYDGAEKELAPLFDCDDLGKYQGRGQKAVYRRSTVGGALAQRQPAGTTHSRAVRAVQHRLEDLARILRKHGTFPPQRHYMIWRPLWDVAERRGRLRRLAKSLEPELIHEVTYYLLCIFAQPYNCHVVMLRAVAASLSALAAREERRLGQ
ncbi:unnamed protein product, partial [Prorocentrum cordatum]